MREHIHAPAHDEHFHMPAAGEPSRDAEGRGVADIAAAHAQREKYPNEAERLIRTGAGVLCPKSA